MKTNQTNHRVCRTLGVVALGVVLLAVFIHPAAAEVVDRVVAIVNDDMISLSDLNEAFAPYMKRIQSMGYSLKEERKHLFEAREQVLEQLINGKLTDQQIDKLHIKVDDKEVDAAIERIKSIKYLTDEQLRDLLEKDGASYEEYRKTIKEQILRSRLVTIEVKSKAVITDEDVAAYYASHPEKYAGEKKYHLRNIIKPLAASGINRDVIQRQMDLIYAKLKSGESFAAVARKHSEAPNAENGGDLGEFNFKDLSPVIQNAVKGLSPGQFTPVLDTAAGLQIFYVADIVETPGKTIKEATPEIQDLLYQKVVDDKFSEWIENLRAQSHIKIIR